MKISTMSIVCGTTACNARCPFCVSKTTPKIDLDGNRPDYRNLNKCCRLAEKSGVTTCLITGKGEPTLYPDLVTDYLAAVRDYFPIIEMQTNGIQLGDLGTTRHMLDNDLAPIEREYLKLWYHLGLTTVCLSAVSYDRYDNQKIYSEAYPELKDTIALLHNHGFSVRLSIMLLDEFIDDVGDLCKLINFCKENKVDQLTVRPIAYPENNENKVTRWIQKHTLSADQLKLITDYIADVGNPVLHLGHGGTVYDFQGQNLCLTDCLTTNDTDDNMRQIIFYPDGKILYDWKYEGARII